MAATLLDMQFSMIDKCRLPCQLSLRKLLYLHFVQMAVIFNFTMTVALPALFTLSIPRYLSTYHSFSRLLMICDDIGDLPDDCVLPPFLVRAASRRLVLCTLGEWYDVLYVA